MTKAAVARIEGAMIAPLDFSLAEKWIAYAQVKPSSEKSYRKGIRSLQKYLEAMKIAVPTRGDLIGYREYLGTHYAAASANLYISACKLFFDFLTVEGFISVNPALHLKSFKISAAHKKDSLSVAMVKKIIGNFDTKTLKGARNKAIFALSVSCGLRTCEIARLNVGDISGDRIFVLSKGADEKVAINIPAGVHNLIQQYLSKRGSNFNSMSPLFSSCSRRNLNGRLTTNSISRLIKSALRDAGFNTPRLTAHSLRHSAATNALIAGASLIEVKQLLRHSKLNTTLIYVHTLEQQKNRAADLAAAQYGF